MKNIIVSIILFCSFTTIYTQWTPDPFCPYPSDHVTRYRYLGNCSIYWECYNGAKYVMECPSGLEFNEPLQQCDSPEIANCDPWAPTTANPNNTDITPDSTTGITDTDSTVSTVSTISTTESSYPPCPNNDTLIYFPYIGDCTKYWECFGGNSYLYQCPANLWWHQEISECDYPGDFCTNSTTTTESTTTTVTDTTVYTETSTTTYETTTSYSTDSTTTWESSTTQTITTPENDPRCYQGGTTFWPLKGECHRYVACVNGISHILTCPINLFFSDRVKDCVRIDESECCREYDCPLE